MRDRQLPQVENGLFHYQKRRRYNNRRVKTRGLFHCEILTFGKEQVITTGRCEWCLDKKLGKGQEM